MLTEHVLVAAVCSTCDRPSLVQDVDVWVTDTGTIASHRGTPVARTSSARKPTWWGGPTE